MTRRSPDLPLVLIALTLSVFGIAMVYSAGQTDTPTFVTTLWRTQAGWSPLSNTLPTTFLNGMRSGAARLRRRTS